MDAVTRIEEIRQLAEEYLASLKEPSDIEAVEVVLTKLHELSAPDDGVNPSDPCYNGEREDR